MAFDVLGALGLAPEAIRQIRSLVRGKVSLDPAELRFAALTGGVSAATLHVKNNTDKPCYEIAIALWPVVRGDVEGPLLEMTAIDDPLLGPVVQLRDGLEFYTGVGLNHGNQGGQDVAVLTIRSLVAHAAGWVTFQAHPEVSCVYAEVFSTKSKPDYPAYETGLDSPGFTMYFPVQLPITLRDVDFCTTAGSRWTIHLETKPPT